MMAVGRKVGFGLELDEIWASQEFVPKDGTAV